MLPLWMILLTSLWAFEDLPAGSTVEREIAAGGVQEWTLRGTAGYYEIDVVARGTRLEVTGFGEQVQLSDAPMRPVRLCMVRDGGEAGVLRVRSLESGEDRSYALTLLYRTASERDAARAEGCRNQNAARGMRGLAEKLGALTAAKAAFEKAGDARGVAEVLTPTGAMLWELGRTADSLAAHVQAVGGWEQQGNGGRQAEAMAKLGAGYLLTPGKSADGETVLRKALALARTAGDSFAECQVAAELVGNAATNGRTDEAREMAKRAIELAKATHDRASEGLLWNHLARVEFNSSLVTAVEHDTKALELRRRLKDEVAIAQSLNNLSVGLIGLGEAERGRAMMEEALEIRRRAGSPNAVANTLHNIGVEFQKSSEYDRAVALYEEALGIWRSTGFKLGEAATLTELATTYFRRGADDRAERLYRQSLQLHLGLNNRRAQANVLALLSGVLHLRGDYGGSASLAREAAAVAGAGGFRMEQARALHGLGRAYLSMNRVHEAVEQLAAARVAISGVNQNDLATVLTTTGSALRRVGDLGGSLAAYDQARVIAETMEDRASLAGIEAGAALTLLAMGETERALASSEKAVETLEDVRSRLADANTRAEFLARRQEVYKAAAAIRIRSGDAAAALEMNEKGRARSLSDLLTAMNDPTPSSASAEERKLRRALSAKSAALVRMRLRRAPAADVAMLRKQLVALQDEYQSLLERLARENPGLARATRAPTPMEIQAALGPQEALLEFSLGASGSYLWIAQRNGVQVVEIGSAAAVETAVRAVRAGLGPGGDAGPELTKLDELLFRGASGRLAGVRRLYVVPDGELHFVPFAALPTLRAMPLSILPSAGFLTQQRGARRKGPVAVFADPVYEAGDVRVAPAVSDTRGGGESLRLGRLRFSAKEAQAIAKLTPRGMAAEGFAATRAAVVNGSLARFGVLHFAAHALVDHGQPEQSAIVLSLYDERGRATDGFLRMYDVARLRLNSPLVVLSACETAVGRSLAGEGPLTLSRAFLAAGASGVVASLWAVDDAATADFMGAFYEAFLRNGQPVAEALRAAQRKVRSQPRWANPYFWAGFIYTGN